MSSKEELVSQLKSDAESLSRQQKETVSKVSQDLLFVVSGVRLVLLVMCPLCSNSKTYLKNSVSNFPQIRGIL